MKNLLALSLSTCFVVLFSNPMFAHEHGDKGHKKHGKTGKMFERTDTNQDGQLELSEFLAHAEARFKRMDIDSNGFVTPKESRKAGKEMREKHRQMRAKHREERKQARDQDGIDSATDE